MLSYCVLPPVHFGQDLVYIKLGKTSKKNLGPGFDATLDQVLTRKKQILDQVLTLQHIYIYIRCGVLSWAKFGHFQSY